MPEQLSMDEVNKIIDDAFNTINPTGQSDMGKIMGNVTPKLKGKADLGEVSKIIKEILFIFVFHTKIYAFLLYVYFL